MAADHGIWFKLWCSAADSPDLSVLSVADYGRWCKFGQYTKRHGCEGVIVLTRPSDPAIIHPLQAQFQCATFDETIACISRFTTCTIQNVSPETVASVSFSVVWRNWHKYQGDMSTSRVHKFRAKKRQSETVKRRGEERRREEKREEKKKSREEEKILPPGGPPKGTLALLSRPSPNGWGTPESLMALYNDACPHECPAAEHLSPKRKEKAARLLKAFPDKSYWQEAFREVHKSPFLRGMCAPGKGHSKSFVASFDWFLSTSKEGIENVVQVYEGKYGNQT